MNYRVFLDTSSETFLGSFDKDPDVRPGQGDLIQINLDKILYVVTRIVPNTTSPTTDLSTVSLDYFVKPQNSSNDSVSLHKSNENVIRKLNRGF